MSKKSKTLTVPNATHTHTRQLHSNNHPPCIPFFHSIDSCHHFHPSASSSFLLFNSNSSSQLSHPSPFSVILICSSQIKKNVEMSLGRELLHLQGIQFDPEVRDRLSESQMSDLAGNACLDFRLVLHCFCFFRSRE